MSPAPDTACIVAISAFFSYFLLGMAERMGLEIEVDLYDPRPFAGVAPLGCNMCGGIVSESLVQLLATEGIELTFGDDAIDAIAHFAFEANSRAENIGARRLHTIMEALLDELCFTASEMTDKSVHMDAKAVRATLEPLLSDEDLSRYIL